MPFPKESSRVATAVSVIEIHLVDTDPDNGGNQQASYKVDILFSDGTILSRRGDLLPQLNATQANQIATFLKAMRTKAVAEFIG